MVELIVGILALFVGIVALWMAKRHDLDLVNQVNELRTHTATLNTIQEAAQKHADSLKEISRSMSTRYIEEFSKCLPEIVRLIASAENEILILCDFPAYGSYSDPNGFFEYQEAIERKIRERKRVTITCFDAKTRNETTMLQFRKASSNWDEWKHESNNDLKLRNYLEAPRKQHHHIGTLTFDQLTMLLEEDDQDMLQKSFAGAESYETNDNIPVSFWMIDKKEAIFSIRGDPDTPMEYLFYTTDSKLLTGFQDMMKGYNP